MKFKTSAIALAVAGTVAAPQIVQAGADEIYASARVGLENVDTAGISDVRMRSFGSRFGARGETDLGNGMTGFGRYEWDVDFADNAQDVPNRLGADGAIGGTGSDEDNFDAGDGDDIDIRHRYVGLKGDFGSALVGQTYHTFYNFVVGPIDNPWWGAGYAMVNYRGRTDNGVTYAGSSGAINFGGTAYFVWEGEEELPDQIELAASFGIGDMTLGVALQNTASDTSHGSAGNDEDIIGLALSGISLGDASLTLGLQSQDDDTSIAAHLAIGNAYVHVEQLSADAASAASSSGDDEDKLLLTLGYTQSLGRKTTAWYEFVSYDPDTGDSDDDVSVVRAVLKYDII